jgi:Fic family protein
MYAPRYSITNKILKAIGEIEGAREVIENAPLVPSFEKDFQSDAVIRTVYHGTHIEGNDLTLSQTKRILEGEEVTAKPRDIQEVINYRNVVRVLDEFLTKKMAFGSELLRRIHATTVYRIVSDDKAGVFRNTQVVIKEEGTGKIIFAPPSFNEVPYLLDDFFAWLNSALAKEIHPILLAGIVHYVLVAIHPFVEGNGRTARAFATYILLKENYDIKRFFAIEEHFDHDLAAYYAAFAKVDQESPNIAARDLTAWLEYFTGVVAVELTKIKEKVRRISVDTRLKVKYGRQIALSERQMRLIEFLTDQKSAVMKDVRGVLPMVSEDTVLRDINDLVKKGIIKKEGSTKASRYVVATPN